MRKAKHMGPSLQEKGFVSVMKVNSRAHVEICSSWSDVSSEGMLFLHCHFLKQACIHPFEWLSNDT